MNISNASPTSRRWAQRRIPEANWPTRLAELISFGFTDLKRKGNELDQIKTVSITSSPHLYPHTHTP